MFLQRIEGRMKLLVVADIHYSLKQFDWLAQIAGKFDLVVLPGDLLDITSTVEQEAQILVVRKYFRRIREQVPLLIASGNHDLDIELSETERAAGWLPKTRREGMLVDGDHFEKDGILFTICPWWDGPIGKEKIAAQLAADAKRPKDKWIWLYHAPPQDRPISWTGKGYFGDEQVIEWIDQYQPDLVFSGHVHQAPFRSGGAWADQQGKTFIFNAGRQLGPVPAFILVDTDSNSATWISQAGQESIDLNEPLPIPEEATS